MLSSYFAHQYQHAHAHSYSPGPSAGVLNLILMSTKNFLQLLMLTQTHYLNFNHPRPSLHTKNHQNQATFFKILPPYVLPHAHAQLTLLVLDVLMLTHVSTQISGAPHAHTHE